VQKVLQRLSAALMVPIVILPIAALFLALGMQLQIVPVIAAGSAIMLEYLPLLFAVGVSIGFTRYDGMAGFAGVVGYIVMTGALTAVNVELDMGVLGGIVSGAVTAWLYFRYHDIRLPEYLGLFSGKRFVPMVSAVANLVLGTLLGYVWLPVQQAIFAFGTWIMGSGAVGLFFYGATNRLLIPTGLHHIIQNLILYTFGVYTDPATGVIYQGEVQRFFANDPTAGNFSAGFFIVMMFSIPAICLAMAHEARPAQRKRTTGILVTAALTSLLTGITEPAEFTFMFAAPLLYGVHAVLTGTATLLSHVLGIRHYGFALPMYIINWRFSENAWLIMPLGVGYAALYYFGTRFAIRRFNLPTLGRTEEEKETSLAGGVSGERLLAALGGSANIRAVDSCLTRLRLSVVDMHKVDTKELERLGAAGLSRVGADYLQVIMGTESQAYAEELRRLIGFVRETHSETLLSPITGQVISLAEVPDDAFARGLLGPGVGIVPDRDMPTVVAPCAGSIEKVFPGGHALVIRSADGSRILLHIGLNTVHLKGEGFAMLNEVGASVRPGEPLVKVDWALLARKNVNMTTVVTLMEQGVGPSEWSFSEPGPATAGLDVIARAKPR
jgi:PTS system N-acetylglucosamine-specific IIC component